MCLGIPGKVVDVRDEEGILVGKVDFGGVTKNVCLDHVRDAVPGEYVLVHVGFALSKLDEVEAKRVFEFLRSIGELGDIESAVPPSEVRDEFSRRVP